LGDEKEKYMKKLAKARVKIEKAKIKAAVSCGEIKEFPDGVGITVRRHGDDNSELVVFGLTDEQLNRIIPQINREVLITITRERNSVKAAFMRFVREGIFHTIVKVVAGLIVGYLLVKIGLR